MSENVESKSRFLPMNLQMEIESRMENLKRFDLSIARLDDDTRKIMLFEEEPTLDIQEGEENMDDDIEQRINEISRQCRTSQTKVPRNAKKILEEVRLQENDLELDLDTISVPPSMPIRSSNVSESNRSLQSFRKRIFKNKGTFFQRFFPFLT